MIIIKSLVILLLLVVSVILLYFISSFLVPLIPTNFFRNSNVEKEVKIFVMSDGVHTDFVLPVVHDFFDWSQLLNSENYKLVFGENSFIGIGWGDKGFYLDIPTWNDLTFKIAFNAMCRPSPTVMHVTSFDKLPNDSKYFRVLQLSLTEYEKLYNYILGYFQRDENGAVCLIPEANYGADDNFYLANYSYHAFKTCNEWVNKGLKLIGVKTAIWSPGAFGIFIHEKGLLNKVEA